jgi:hypothetical protein
MQGIHHSVTEVEFLLEKAQAAYDYWNENDLDMYNNIILLPHEEEDLNVKLIEHIEAKLKKNGGASAITEKLIVLSVADFHMQSSINKRIISKQISEGILELYSMYEFTGKLIIGSFDLPSGRKLRNLLACSIASEEFLIDKVILKAID